jgi:hypothetical protein
MRSASISVETRRSYRPLRAHALPTKQSRPLTPELQA